jgi:hypothetical protein
LTHAPASVAGLLLTSARAADAVLAGVRQLLRGSAADTAAGDAPAATLASAPMPIPIPVFALGRAAATIRASGAFAWVGGDGAHNAAELVSAALAHALAGAHSDEGITGAGDSPAGALPWLFACGEVRMETVAAAFASAGVPLCEMVVYRMQAVPPADVERAVTAALASRAPVSPEPGRGEAPVTDTSVDAGGGVATASPLPVCAGAHHVVLAWCSPAGVAASLGCDSVHRALATGRVAIACQAAAPCDGRALATFAAIGDTTAAAVRAALSETGAPPAAVHVFPTPNAEGFEALLRRLAGDHAAT